MAKHRLEYWALALSLLCICGCAAAAAPTASSVATSAATSGGSQVALSPGVTDLHGPAVPAPGRYLDFKDVLIPPGLRLNKDKTTIFHVNATQVGLMVFDGQVEPRSLTEFFSLNMIKDGWEMVASFGYPATALFFSKPAKTCVIHIIESWIYTRATIWVTPHRDKPPIKTKAKIKPKSKAKAKP